MRRPRFSSASLRRGVFLAVVCGGTLQLAACFAADPADAPRIAPPPVGEAVRAPVSRDLWISSVDEEQSHSNGGAPKLKFKSYQEFSLVDFDPAPFRGRVVLGGTLHVRLSGDERLHRMTVGGVSGPWVEGTSRSDAKEGRGSSFLHRDPNGEPWVRNQGAPWGARNGDATAAISGQSGQPWASVDATPPDADGWQRIAVDPRVLGARIAGVSEGFVVFDDTGSEWSRDGEKYTFRHFPNRFVHSREAGRDRAPYWTIYLGGEDKTPPAAVDALRVETEGLPWGEAILYWKTPADVGGSGVAGSGVGGSGVVGFRVADGKTPVDASRIPRATPPGGEVRLHLPAVLPRHDNPFRTHADVTIWALDGAGNVSAPFTQRIPFAPPKELPNLPGMREAVEEDSALRKAAYYAERDAEEGIKPPPPPPAKPELPWPTLGGAGVGAGGTSVAIWDPLDKMDLRTGALVPKAPPGYASANHLWNAADRMIRLSGARRENVAFQIVLRKAPADLALELAFPGLQEKPRVKFWQFEFVPGAGGLWADPLTPFKGGPPAAATGPGGEKWAFLLCELDLAAKTPPGVHKGSLTLAAGQEKLTLPVELEAFDFEMPVELSFLPEMNCYDLPADERAYYRLAQENRTVLNRLPYHQNGRIEEGCAPKIVGGGFEWTKWDARFRPLLDGSLFADLPRGAVPIECFYLPIHENWPAPIEPNYNGDDWAHRAFPPEYRRRIVEGSKAFAEHLSQAKAERTLFHLFLNGKNDFKRQGWSRGSSPWLLDEPANFRDFMALRWFGEAMMEGAAAARPTARLVFRADVSRPQWQRDSLDGLLDYNVTAIGPHRRYERMVGARRDQEKHLVVEYGTANALEASNQQAVGWSLQAWTRGAVGVLPWQTIGKDQSWNEADPLSLFYPGSPKKLPGPVPSIRLKGFLRGQQDVEYLELWQAHFQIPAATLRHELGLTLPLDEGVLSRIGAAHAEDAGGAAVDQLRPERLAAFRRGLGRALSKLRPTAKAQPAVERLRTRATVAPLDWEVSASVGERPDRGRSGHYHPGAKP